jgi:hypothetical protein
MQENGQILGPHAKTPIAMIYRHASNRASNGRRPGTKRPLLDAAAKASRGANAVFSRSISRRRDRTHAQKRGDINKSAKI